MQTTTPPRYSLIRRVLFPYSGEEQLSPRQGLRIIVVWALLFTAPMLLCTLAASLFAAASVTKMALLLVIAFLSGVIIFGASAWVIVIVNNRSVQTAQKRKDARTSSTSGGRHGS